VIKLKGRRHYIPFSPEEQIKQLEKFRDGVLVPILKQKAFADLTQVVKELGRRLAVSDEAITYANAIIREVVRRDLHLNHCLRTFPAAALYIASIIVKEKRTQREIAEASRLTILTVRKHYLELIRDYEFRRYLDTCYDLRNQELSGDTK